MISPRPLRHSRSILLPYAFYHHLPRALPNDFRMKINNLNKQSMESHQLKLDQTILMKTPKKYHDVIKSLDLETKEEIDYILVMYEPPLNERRKCNVRDKIVKMIEQFGEKEQEYFIYLLQSLDCYPK